MSIQKNRETLRTHHKELQMDYIRTSQEPQSPSLLSRMTYPRDLQGLPLRQTKGSIKMYSSSAMNSSRDIERGRNPKRPYMSTSSLNFSKHLGRTESGQTLPSNHSLPPSKIMTRNLKWQREGLPGQEHDSTPPALLYRIQMNSTLEMSPRRKSSESTSQSTHGWQKERRRPYRYQRTSPKLLNSSTYTPSIQKP